MTNVERNKANLRKIDEMCKNFPFSSDEGDIVNQIMTLGLLEDISKSLASIADSLERLAPREHEDLN